MTVFLVSDEAIHNSRNVHARYGTTHQPLHCLIACHLRAWHVHQPLPFFIAEAAIDAMKSPDGRFQFRLLLLMNGLAGWSVYYAD
jgi:hypothetical protein